MNRRLVYVLLIVLPCAAAAEQPAPSAVHVSTLAALSAPVQLTRDTDGITHIRARNETDAFVMQGWVHARDRLFQMDVDRRAASGTLAELVGPGALAQDVQLRTLGLRRASERSLAVLLPDTRAALEAYARGVNAYVSTHPLPPEYGALEITRIPAWTALDSVVVGRILAFQLSFELDVDATIALESYVAAGVALGFDGRALYFEDLDRAAPFDPASTIPDAMRRRHPGEGHRGLGRSGIESRIHPVGIELAKRLRAQLKGLPAFSGIVDARKRPGSNLWAVSGRFTTSGRPMIANDPHLELATPAIWYPIGLEVPGRLEAFGDSLAGVPAVVHGYNRHIAWGSTNTLFDVTDTYQEQVVPDAASPSGLSTVYKGMREPIVPIPEVFRVNQVGDGVADNLAVVPPGGGVPAATLIVPRRNNGPIVQLDPATGVALSVQWTGFSATHETDAILKFMHARSMDEFVAALQFFDVGSQNWVVGDARGSIGYFTSGEVPVREDLQAGFVDGLSPHFIRNGQGGNEWLPVLHPQPHQALAYEVLPFAELPQIIDPPAGFFVNANNDPVGVTLDNDPLNTLRPGGGIYYLSYTFDDPSGLRPGQITERLNRILAERDRRVSFDDMQSIQADVTLRDAEFFAPYIAAAFERATRPGANPALAAAAAEPGVAEAVGRLGRWDYTSQSGLVEGWDAGKPAGRAPTRASIDASVAATLYNVWRSRFIANTIDKVIGGAHLPVPDSVHVLSALRQLLVTFPARGGRGASGVDFFPLPGVADAADRRDVVVLASLADALSLLASDAFRPAFGGSTRQDDYRWGKLHRIVFNSVLGGPFSIPPAGGAFPAPLPGLDGIPTDGGFNTVDAASFDPRAASLNGFMFSHGPSHRFVAEVAPELTTRAVDSWPGGTSGVLGSPLYMQFLPRWLANESVRLHLGIGQVRAAMQAVELFAP